MTETVTNSDVSNETIAAFHMMWDQFPHPVLLLKKCRDIIAINKRAEEVGVRVGRKCYRLTGNNEIHEGCKANQALAEGAAQRMVSHNKDTNRLMDAYWLPVPDGEDVYLHFAIEIDVPAEN